MAKLWAGRSSGVTDKLADDFNSSIGFDSRMYAEDIEGSMAHALMLARCGIISDAEADGLCRGLKGILDDLRSGALSIDPDCEDIHMFVEQVLTERVGDLGKKLHTARSRNDQVALDLRMYLRGECDGLNSLLKELIEAITDKAEEGKSCIMPGYTHLQRAQPIIFSHQLLAYAWMLLRDISRINDCRKRINVSPIGSCALAGTTYNTDRVFEAEQLGFASVCLNSIDGVSDRDFCVELMSCLSLVMMHLSRLSEELILWSSWEFGFIALDDAYTTGSSIMPQKKNSDMAELVRGKTGRVYGDLMGLLTTLKGLPLAYNKDMQEDKEAVFDACDTVKACLKICAPMIATMKLQPAAMLKAAKEGFINATDLADYLTKLGMPFRDAYKAAGRAVALCIKKGCVLEELSLDEYADICGDAPVKPGEDLYAAIDLESCVKRRSSLGGTSPESVETQIFTIRAAL